MTLNPCPDSLPLLRGAVAFVPMLLGVLALVPHDAQAGDTSCAFEDAATRFENLLPEASLEGGAMLLGTPKGLLLERYFGSYDENTRVPVASASKLLSAVRIAQLAEAGMLDLHAPVSTYLPQFTGLKATMTVDQMFSHTAGYGDDAAALVTLNPNITLAEAVDSIACCIPLPGAWVPGGQFAYGGISMHIAGRVAEVVGGGDWEQQWLANIAVPLGISSIDYRAFNESTTNYGIGGSARSTLRDYGRVLHMLLNGGWSEGSRLLHPGSVASIFTDRVGELPLAYAPGTAVPPVRYGLGNWLDPARIIDGEGARGHSLGAFGFFPFIDFERDLFGIFMIRGPAGINTSALPVYEQMLADIGSEFDSAACTEAVYFDGIAGDGFESPAVGQSTP